MSWRRILVLLVLVAGLGTYLWVYEIPKARQEGKTDAEIEQMKAKYQASIDRIKAEGEGKSQ